MYLFPLLIQKVLITLRMLRRKMIHNVGVPDQQANTLSNIFRSQLICIRDPSHSICICHISNFIKFVINQQSSGMRTNNFRQSIKRFFLHLQIFPRIFSELCHIYQQSTELKCSPCAKDFTNALKSFDNNKENLCSPDRGLLIRKTFASKTSNSGIKNDEISENTF